MPWDFALILLVLGVVVPWRGAVRIRQLLRYPHLASADRLALYASTIAFQWVAAAVVVWRCSARGWNAQRLGIAMPYPGRTAATAVVLTCLITANQLYSLRRLARLPLERQGFQGEMARKLMPQNTLEALAFAALAATVALCEEFLYRGFVLAVLEDAAAGSLVFAVVASSVLFALAHLYQGRRGLAATLVAGLLFACLRIWTASLAPSISAHLFADLSAGLAAPRLLRRAPPAVNRAPSPSPTPHDSPKARRAAGDQQLEKKE